MKGLVYESNLKGGDYVEERGMLNSLSAKMQTTKFYSCRFSKNVNSELYHIENSKTRGQRV